MVHSEQQDMIFTAQETRAIEELKGTMHTKLEQNGGVCLSNGMDIGQEILLLHGKSHKETNAVEELSQSMEGIAIEKTSKGMVDIDQVNDCSEGCAEHFINKLEVACSNNGSASMEGENGSRLEIKEEVFSTKPSKITTLEVLEGQKTSPPMTSVKCMAQAMTQRKHVCEATENGKPLTRVLNITKNNNNLSSKRSSTIKASSSKFTITRPFALATDRRAEERPAATVPHCPSDFSQDVKTLRQKFFVAKSSHSDNSKCSVSQDLKVQTHATGFNFRSDERAKKRKEFYSKLQEKFNAQEEEKTQMQARTEKENEEALKVLRRSLTFKASPMPSFYQEGPPPKVELKKTPTTQAKSPNFSSRSRRGSSESVSNGAYELEQSQSNGLQLHLESDDVDVLHQSKDCMTNRLVKCSLLDSLSDQILNSNYLPLSNNEGAHITDEKTERTCGETPCENELTISNQKSNEGTNARHLSKGAVTKANSDRHERSQGKCGSNVLRNCVNKSLTMSSSMSNKVKPKVQPLPYGMKEDLSPKTNKTTKKERLKALTPYFRKRESIGNARQSPIILAEEVAIDLGAGNIVNT